jgi:hypothetical protein
MNREGRISALRAEQAAEYARLATERITELQREIGEWGRERQFHVRRLAELGFTCREIGRMLGMSAPRVSKIMGRGWKIAQSGRVD